MTLAARERIALSAQAAPWSMTTLNASLRRSSGKFALVSWRELLFAELRLEGFMARSSTVSEAELLSYRSHFPILADRLYLISHTLGAMPRQARDAAAEFVNEWDTLATATWDTWQEVMRALSQDIATVLGVEAGTVALFPNCSMALSSLASSFSYTSHRRKVVYDDLNFTTVHYVWQAQERAGAEICIVRSRDGVSLPVEELLEAIDEQTLIVPISHVSFRTGAMYDVERIIERAHEVGALVMLDCYQSAGIVPLELGTWKCDFACGGSIKWACGGPGAGYLYVRPDLLERLRPTMTGWLAHAEPFAFDMGPMRYSDTMARFSTGIPSMPGYYTARAGWELLARIGVEAIRKKSLRQTALLRELCHMRGFEVRSPAAERERGGTVFFDFPGAREVSQLLTQRGVLQDYRPGGGMRVSPHYYTTDDELHALVEEVDRARKALDGAGAWSQ